MANLKWIHVGAIIVGLIAAVLAALGGLALIDASFASSIGLATPLPGNEISGLTTTAAEYLVFLPALLMAIGALVIAGIGYSPDGYKMASWIGLTGAILSIFLANWALGFGFLLGIVFFGAARAES
jgi:hypothetical protein